MLSRDHSDALARPFRCSCATIQMLVRDHSDARARPLRCSRVTTQMLARDHSDARALPLRCSCVTIQMLARDHSDARARSAPLARGSAEVRRLRSAFRWSAYRSSERPVGRAVISLSVVRLASRSSNVGLQNSFLLHQAPLRLSPEKLMESAPRQHDRRSTVATKPQTFDETCFCVLKHICERR